MKHRLHTLTGMAAVLVFALLMIVAQPLLVQQLYAQPLPDAITPTSKIPLDPAIRTGKLPNGITYFIRHNELPDNRAELRLVINAGSVLERDDQRGLAHFVEHMAFNGTKNFPKDRLVQFLEGIGMRFGADLNAYTSFDETVYMLQLPTDNRDVLVSGVQILEDWAHNLSFDPEEIDKERGVVREEWRMRRGADARMREVVLPVVLANSRYAERMPIGIMAVIDTFKYETLKKFYRDWYRPDLMAVVAVGDFDVDAMEKMIREHFGAIPAASGAPKRDVANIPPHADTKVAIATDPEATSTSVSVDWKSPRLGNSTVADYRRSMVEQLYNAMLSQRLYELTRRSDAPFSSASSSYGVFGRTTGIYELEATTPTDKALQGLEALLTEAERVARHGFTAGELEREKAGMLSGIERSYQERDKTESGRLARELVSYYLSNEPAPGISYEYELYRTLLPTVTLADVNALAKRFMSEGSRVVTLTMPQKDGVAVPTREELLAVLPRVEKLKIEAYTENVSTEPLIPNPPKGGSVVSQKVLESIGVTEWTLSNGVRVILKPTEFKNDEILMTAFSPGGTSLVPDTSLVPAQTAATLIAGGGVGGFDQVELDKLLAGRVASATPYISELQEGFSGSATPKDLELMFQLVWLRMTSPRMDPEFFQAFRSNIEPQLQNRAQTPMGNFQDTVGATLTSYNPRRRPMSVASLSQLDLETSFRIYRNRFADASDFTFILVGNFTPEGIKPLVEQYLGGLPSTNRTEKWRDLGVRPPQGVVSKVIHKGSEPNSQVFLGFTGPFEYFRENRFYVGAMMDILQLRLRESLREESGGIYAVGVFPQFTQYPRPSYMLGVVFGCAPKRVDELVGRTLDVIKGLRENGPTEDELTKIKENHLRDREVNLRENRYWLRALDARYQSGENPETIPQEDELVESLSAANIQEAAKRYFQMDNYVRVVLMPE